MALRTWQIAVISIGVLTPAIMWWSTREPAVTAGTVYAYDTVARQIYATSETLPPMTAPSGSEAGVKAQVLWFDGDPAPTVVFLTTYTPEARRIMESTRMTTPKVVAGTLVRRPDDADWTPLNTPDGLKIHGCASELAAGRAWKAAIPP